MKKTFVRMLEVSKCCNFSSFANSKRIYVFEVLGGGGVVVMAKKYVRSGEGVPLKRTKAYKGGRGVNIHRY